MYFALSPQYFTSVANRIHPIYIILHFNVPCSASSACMVTLMTSCHVLQSVDRKNIRNRQTMCLFLQMRVSILMLRRPSHCIPNKNALFIMYNNEYFSMVVRCHVISLILVMLHFDERLLYKASGCHGYCTWNSSQEHIKQLAIKYLCFIAK